MGKREAERMAEVRKFSASKPAMIDSILSDTGERG
jgi:hypothetical protein